MMSAWKQSPTKDMAPRSRERRWISLLLLTRPYSWVDAALNSLLGLVVVVPDASGGQQVLAGLAGVAIWWSLNWVSESFQRDPGRVRPGLVMAVLPFFFAGALLAGATGAGAGVVASLATLFALIFAYPFKARARWVGPMGPLIRGLQTSLVFVLGGLAGGGMTDTAWAIAGGLALLQGSRTLVADVRDVATDEHELPRRIGGWPSLVVALGLLLVGAAVLATESSVAGATIVILSVLAVAAILIVAGGVERAYEAHFGFVLVSVLLKCFVYSTLTGGTALAFLFLLCEFGLLLTYWRVPRSANRSFRERLARSVRVIGGRV